MKLEITLHSQWIAGTGRGSGSAHDAVVRRDNLGLPMFPGRSLRGLLRDAVSQAEALGWYEGTVAVGSNISAALFGDWVGPGHELPPEEVKPGILGVSDARFPEEFRQWLASVSNSDQRSAIVSSFFGTHHSTAIDRETGVAKSQSLRGIEVAEPATLHADIELLGNSAFANGDWEQLLESVFPLIPAIGANRHRGFGRASFQILAGESA